MKKISIFHQSTPVPSETQRSSGLRMYEDLSDDASGRGEDNLDNENEDKDFLAEEDEDSTGAQKGQSSVSPTANHPERSRQGGSQRSGRLTAAYMSLDDTASLDSPEAYQEKADEEVPADEMADDDVEYVDIDTLLADAPSNTAASAKAPGKAPATGKHEHKTPAHIEKSGTRPAPSAPAKTARNAAMSQKHADPAAAGKDNHKHAAGDDAVSSRLHDSAFWVHIILPLAIIAIALIAFIRYQIWARGTDIQIDAGNETRFNVEVNDEMVLLPESRLEGHEDDGITTILCLGDAPFSDDTSESGLAGQITALAGSSGTTVETINAAIPNSQVACFNASYQTDTQHDMEDTFNLFYVAYAISIDDYSTMETVASLHTDEPQYAAAIENLKNTDFSKVDIIAIMYDGIDYVNQSPAYNPDLPVSEQINTYQGALSNAFSLIQQKYPYIRVVFLSPTYMLLEDANGNLQDARTENIGNGTLAQYWQYAMDVCGDSGVSFLDNYYGSVNDTNYTEYLSDNMHLNNAGRTKVADHFVYKVINNEYAEYDAGSLNVAGTASS